jgi:hypothetical protein
LEKIVVPTHWDVVLLEKIVVPWRWDVALLKKIAVPTEKIVVPTEKIVVPMEKIVVPTEKIIVPTEKITVPTEKITVPMEKIVVPSRWDVVLLEKIVESLSRHRANTSEFSRKKAKEGRNLYKPRKTRNPTKKSKNRRSCSAQPSFKLFNFSDFRDFRGSYLCI